MAIFSLFFYALLGLLAASAAGALSGAHLAGNEFGIQLAAYLGALYGLLGGLGSVAVGLFLTQVL